MALIDQVKSKLNITWVDEDTDRRVADIIASADATLKYKLGISDTTYNFATPGLENMLFLALCLYEWNHAANEFDANYHNEIAQCRALHEVAYYEAREGNGDAES